MRTLYQKKQKDKWKLFKNKFVELKARKNDLGSVEIISSFFIEINEGQNREENYKKFINNIVEKVNSVDLERYRD